MRLDHLLSKEKKQVRKLVILFSYREIIENTKEIERLCTFKRGKEKIKILMSLNYLGV